MIGNLISVKLRYTVHSAVVLDSCSQTSHGRCQGLRWSLWKQQARPIHHGRVYQYTYRLSKNSSGTKSYLSIGRKAVEFDPDEYQEFKCHRYFQKSYVPTPLRAPIITWEQTQNFVIKNSTFFSYIAM